MLRNNADARRCSYFELGLPVVVLAVEIDEPTTMKIRECGVKKKQHSFILVIIASGLIFPINICEFFLYEKLIEMRGDYVLICKGNKSLIPLAY